MPKYLIALTNPSSPDKEDAFNAWYNTYHVPEVCALDGFVGAKRFKADATQFADPDEIREFCKDRLAAYKYPRIVEIIDELPKTVTGKVLRRELRDNA